MDTGHQYMVCPCSSHSLLLLLLLIWYLLNYTCVCVFVFVFFGLSFCFSECNVIITMTINSCVNLLMLLFCTELITDSTSCTQKVCVKWFQWQSQERFVMNMWIPAFLKVVFVFQSSESLNVLSACFLVSLDHEASNLQSFYVHVRDHQLIQINPENGHKTIIHSGP